MHPSQHRETKHVCENNSVTKLIVSRLLHAEFDSQGMTSHSKVYNKIGKILSEEWRGIEELDTIKRELKEKKDEKQKYQPAQQPAKKLDEGQN